MKKKNNRLQYGVLLLSAVMAGPALADAKDDSLIKPAKVASQSASDSHLKDLISRTELVFHGELLEIRERLSVENIPYTFVTYRVKQVINGLYAPSTITLKFVGGHFPNGNRLSASNSPKVSVGEEAILLVQKSVDTGCDFVDCENGRFVVENGEVVAANQSAISLNNEGDVEYVNFAERLNGSVKSGPKKSDVSAFIAHLKKLATAHSLRAKRPNTVFVDTDINAPFKAYSVLTKAGKAPNVAKRAVETKPRKPQGSEFDRWEVEQLRQNGGNPLLNAAKSAEQSEL